MLGTAISGAGFASTVGGASKVKRKFINIHVVKIVYNFKLLEFEMFNKKMRLLFQISQHWFGENERALSTALMTMSQTLGQAIGIGLTPFMIPNYENITRLNIIWFIPALLGFIICLAKVMYSTFLLGRHFFITIRDEFGGMF